MVYWLLGLAFACLILLIGLLFLRSRLPIDDGVPDWLERRIRHRLADDQHVSPEFVDAALEIGKRHRNGMTEQEQRQAILQLSEFYPDDYDTIRDRDAE